MSAPDPRPNTRLRAVRANELRLSQDEMAAALRRLGAPACTKKTVQRWEWGEVAWPTAGYRRALAALTGKRMGELGFRDPKTADRPVCEDDPMDRRSFMTGAAGLTAAAAAEPYAALAHVLARPGRPLALADAEALLEDTAVFFTRESTEPAAALLPDLAAHLGLLTGLAAATPGESVRRVLVLAAGTTAALAGWCAMDTGAQQAAAGYWDAAISAAREAGDGPLTALVLAYLSYRHSGRGQHSEAWRLLDAAGRQLRGRGDARARSWIAARQAEEAAALGEHTPALVALERAMTAHDYAVEGAGRPWADFFDSARLGSMAVHTYAGLQHPQLAPAADAVMADLPAGELKTRAVILGDVAAARLASGDLDAACETARAALAATVAGQAILGRERLAGLLPALAEHADATPIRALREDLAAAGIGQRAA